MEEDGKRQQVTESAPRGRFFCALIIINRPYRRACERMRMRACERETLTVRHAQNVRRTCTGRIQGAEHAQRHTGRIQDEQTRTGRIQSTEAYRTHRAHRGRTEGAEGTI